MLRLRTSFITDFTEKYVISNILEAKASLESDLSQSQCEGQYKFAYGFPQYAKQLLEAFKKERKNTKFFVHLNFGLKFAKTVLHFVLHHTLVTRPVSLYSLQCC